MKTSIKFAHVGTKRIALKPDGGNDLDPSFIEEWSAEYRDPNSGTAAKVDALAPRIIAELTGETEPAKVDAASDSLKQLAYAFAFAEVLFLTISGPDTTIAAPTRETIQSVPESVLFALVNAADPRAQLLKSEADLLAKKPQPMPDASTEGVG